MDVRRVTIATGIGLLTGCYCAASLFIPALKPPEMTSRPEVWWLAMLIMAVPHRALWLAWRTG